MKYSVGVIVPSASYPTQKSIRNPNKLESGRGTRELFEPFEIDEKVIIMSLKEFTAPWWSRKRVLEQT